MEGDAVGRLQADQCLAISQEFHRRVLLDPVLSPLFPKDPGPLTERFALFLDERLGGPATYTATRGKQSLVCRHAPFSISTRESERWLHHMQMTLAHLPIEPELVAFLMPFFTATAATMTDPLIPFYDLPLDALALALDQNPDLLAPTVTGHGLLRRAAENWDVPRVRQLLEKGANPNAQEPRGHGVLYRAANSRSADEADGARVVEQLIEFGANVNLPSGPGKCTPLHMAARRGHVLIAQVLLAAGADLEAPDQKGETPLRRAVNCRHPQMVAFLVAKGADAARADHRGTTPLDAARTQELRRALRGG